MKIKNKTVSYAGSLGKTINIEKSEINEHFSIKEESVIFNSIKNKRHVKIDSEKLNTLLSPDKEPDNIADKELLAEIEKLKKDLNK
jgi:hypothetical protein